MSHSHIDQLVAMLRQAAADGAKRLAVHALLDGRDVHPKSALTYIEKMESEFIKIREEYGVKAWIASGGGRMRITMDRYNADWAMVERGWRTHVRGEGRLFDSAAQAVETMYAETNPETDQFLEAFVVAEDGKASAPIVDGDAVLFFNFRGDRAIEMSRAFEEQDFSFFDRGSAPSVIYAGMMEYDGDLKIPSKSLVGAPAFDRTLSEYLCAAGVASFAISETQKYGHVTYFWNGNRSGYIDEDLETYVEIPSDNLPFDQAPKMKAKEISDATIELLRTGKYRFGRVNYPNGDMVGHTGNLKAAIVAAEAVDQGLARLLECVRQLKGITVVLADHGNSEQMFTEKEGKRTIHTAHTTNPVPFFIDDPAYQGEYQMRLPERAGLANVAATLMELLGFQPPSDYETSLIQFS